MLSITRKTDLNDWNVPLSGYLAYIFSKFFHLLNPCVQLLERVESLTVWNDIQELRIDKPIYITGLARSGTTILLEMLNKHPDLATHQYKHVLIPYLPYWFHHAIKAMKIYSKPVERIHKDGIFITRDSPEAVEEIFWRRYFKDFFRKNISDIIDNKVSNARFEKFYLNHIKKLIISQRKTRYLAKNNYNCTRIEYIYKIFPNSKFLITIRNPVDQIASLIKQDLLFSKMEQNVPMVQDWMNILGHFEFGYNKICINANSTNLIEKIYDLWEKKATYVKGWAYYWDSIYTYIANLLENNSKVRDATYLVKYDELCEKPSYVVDEILKHVDLTINEFRGVRQYYVNNLHKPTYYTHNFTQEEIRDINEITRKTASRLGIE